MKKLIIRIVLFLIIIILLIYLFFLIQVFTLTTANIDNIPTQADAIVVLGYSLENGETPSNWLTKRLEIALQLYNNGYSDKIIVTGGKGPNDNTAVSLSMRKWLIDNEVPRDAILFEDKSATTYENFVYVKNICDTYNLDSIIVVTNDFHMYRSLIIAKEFFDNYYGVESPIDFNLKKSFSYLREPLSLFKYYFFDKNTRDQIIVDNLASIREKFKPVIISQEINNYKNKNNYTSYDIDVTYNPYTNVIEGSQLVTYKNTFDSPMESIVMNLYHNRYSPNYPTQFYPLDNDEYGYIEITSVKINDKNVMFHDFISHLIIETPPLKSNKTIKFVINFKAKIPKNATATGGNDNMVWATDLFPTIASYDNGGFNEYSYYPFSEYAENSISNYNVSMKLPEKFYFVANGQQEVIQDGAFKTITYETNMVRNFGFAIGKNIKSTTFLGSNNIDIILYHTNEHHNLYKILNNVDIALSYYNDNIGSYPYPSLIIVEGQLNSAVGVSSSGFIIIDSLYIGNPNTEYTLLETIGRQWFGNTLISDPIEEKWLTTGLPGYLANVINNESDNYFINEYNLLKEDIKNFDNKNFSSNINSYDTINEYYKIQYTRSKLMLYSLSNKLGKNKFSDVLKLYYKTYAFNNVTFEDFATTCEIVYKNSLTDFFQQWLYDDELPELTDKN